MFMFTEINYRLSRTPGRSLILALTAVMLVASMGAYLGNLQVSQAALTNLAENIPVTVRVVNRTGTQTARLSIDTAHFDTLMTLGVHGVTCTSAAAGAWGREVQAQDPFAGGDTSITAASCFEALPVVNEDTLTMLEGCGPGFLSGGEAFCGISESYAQLTGLNLGDELTLPVYTAACSQYSTRYTAIGQQTLKVAALYPYNEVNGERTPDVLVPVTWLRHTAESSGAVFYYTSLSAVLDDPLHLTQFKEQLPGLGFVRVDRTGNSDSCDAISMEDELFIKTAEELRENLQTYRSFQIPFFALITVMVMLAVFLVLRGGRRDMAIASSLGEPRLRISFVHFSAAVLTQMAGGCLAVVLLMLRMGITMWDSLWILLVYLLCASTGTCLALFQLLRFDTLTLLTKND